MLKCVEKVLTSLPHNNLLFVINRPEEELDLTPDHILLGHIGVMDEACPAPGAWRTVSCGYVLQTFYNCRLSTTILK